MENTVELNPPKPKVGIRGSSHPPHVKAKAIERLVKGDRQIAIATDLGVPQTTIAQWSVNAGLNRNKTHSLANRVKHELSAKVDKLTTKAMSEVEALLKDSLDFGRSVLGRANGLVPDADHQTLVSVANAGKVGVTIARQALGLNDSTESVIVRVDLVGQAQPEQPVIELDPQP